MLTLFFTFDVLSRTFCRTASKESDFLNTRFVEKTPPSKTTQAYNVNTTQIILLSSTLPKTI